jgi:hypothetical protein
MTAALSNEIIMTAVWRPVMIALRIYENKAYGRLPEHRDKEFSTVTGRLLNYVGKILQSGLHGSHLHASVHNLQKPIYYSNNLVDMGEIYCFR